LQVQLINATQKEKQTMKTNFLLITLVLFAALVLAGCAPRASVGAVQTESQSVELGDSNSVRVDINMGAGNLEVTGGAEKLLEADFTYNAAKLKPEVEYMDGTLVIRQPGAKGLPVLKDITDYRNEWVLRLYDEVPMDLSVNMGGGSSDLQVADLSLTRLNVILGAGTSTIDLRGDWPRDLDITIDAGAADVTVRLPRNIGVRAEVDRGPAVIEAPGLTQDGDIYTNAAYGVSDVTLHVNISTGIGRINLEVEDQ
jgi:hypothetical protein